jgi:Asp-tRNA(Asn)/Glu-tRNA(Gln) amidotransferase A subunit family amidase
MKDQPASTLRLTETVCAIALHELTARELAEAHLARIAATDDVIQAWAHLDPVHVRAEADRCDAAARTARGQLAGIGVGVGTSSQRESSDREWLTDFAGPPARDAESVTRLRAGASSARR